MQTDKLTQERLHELLLLGPNTGVMTWRLKRKGVAQGKIAGSENSNGYVQIKIDGVKYLRSRLVYMYLYGTFPTEIDHKNRNRLDDRFGNLRAVTRSENFRNKSLYKNSITGVPGVTIDKYGKYVAYICKEKKRTYLGSYSDKLSALLARYTAEVALNWNEFNTSNELISEIKRLMPEFKG